MPFTPGYDPCERCPRCDSPSWSTCTGCIDCGRGCCSDCAHDVTDPAHPLRAELRCFDCCEALAAEIEAADFAETGCTPAEIAAPYEPMQGSLFPQRELRCYVYAFEGKKEVA